MVISTLHRPLAITLATLGLMSLVACGGGGGGGGGNSSTPPVVIDDTTPNAISFTATEGVEPNAVIISPVVTITGINTATPISISGGEYSIAGGAFTSTAGTISNGQTLAVRLTASDKTNTAKAVTVTVGGVSATFSVTTFADTTADAFSFTAVTGAELNKEYTSEAITINGIDVAVPVSITGGLYSINGGEFTSAAGTVSAGQTITVKATSGNNTDTTQNAVLNVGSINGTFAVSTIPDTTPPVAEFKFPTPYTMSEANSVKVRGTATDDHAITSVKVVVRSYNLATPSETISTTEVSATPKADGDYSSWTVDVPLTPNSENEIKVVATDDRDNEIEIANANKVVIRQADLSSAFPDEENQFNSMDSKLLIDDYDGRNRILIVDTDRVMSVDLNSGSRTTLFNEHCGLTGWAVDPLTKHIFGMCGSTPLKEYDLETGQVVSSYDLVDENLSTVRAMAIDRSNGRAQLVLVEASGEKSGSKGRVSAFSLNDKTFSIISQSDKLPELQANESILVNGDEYFVPGGRFDSNFGGQIISISALNGERKIVSDNSIGFGDDYAGYFDEVRTAFLTGSAIDKATESLIAFEFRTNKIFSVSLETFNRKTIGTISYAFNSGNAEISSFDLKINESSGLIYLADERKDAILIVDLQTAEKVILSKVQNN